MASLRIDLSQGSYDFIKERAAKNRRSLSAEVRAIMDAELFPNGKPKRPWPHVRFESKPLLRMVSRRA
jgi:plasmid stability protein